MMNPYEVKMIPLICMACVRVLISQRVEGGRAEWVDCADSRKRSRPERNINMSKKHYGRSASLCRDTEPDPKSVD